VWYVLTLFRSQCTLTSKESVPCRQGIFAELEQRRLGLVSKIFQLGYVVDIMWLCNMFLSQYFGSNLSLILRALYSSSPNVARNQKNKRSRPGSVQKAMLFRKPRDNKNKSIIIYCSWVKYLVNRFLGKSNATVIVAS